VKVVLRQDLETLGNRGDVLDVADGYARNFLIPGGLAIPATAGIARQAQSMRRSRDLKDAKNQQGAEEIARRLVSLTVSIPARAGAEGRLFGSVTSQDIVEAIAAQAGVDIDRHKVLAHEPIRTLGTHQVSVRLHPEVQFQVTLEVVPA
jgi:large subunit ribosomal protein L9